jgi:3D (Asp-Asp-Asp) domain-containing protein
MKRLVVMSVMFISVLAAVLFLSPSNVTAPTATHVQPTPPTFTFFPRLPKPPPPPPSPLGRSIETYTITAYTANYESTGKRRGSAGWGITASGDRVKSGVTAACPASMPFGTVVDIAGVGRRTCTDRGGAITGKHIDIYTADLDEALQFGRQRLPITIKYIPGSDVYENSND